MSLLPVQVAIYKHSREMIRSRECMISLFDGGHAQALQDKPGRGIPWDELSGSPLFAMSIGGSPS